MNRLTFEVDGVKYDVRRPKPEEEVKAQAVYNKKISEALANGSLFRDTLLNHMTVQGLWSSEIQKEVDSLKIEINKNRDKLKARGFKKSEGKRIAIKIRTDLDRLNYLNRHVNRLDLMTAEAQAEQARFEYYVSACTVDTKTGTQVYKNLDDYREKAALAEDNLSFQASTKLMYLFADVDPDAESQSEENKFLRKFGYVDDKLRLVDEKGRLVDSDGKYIDEQGRYIKWNEDFTVSSYVDSLGNDVDALGEPIIEVGEWLDDEGNPIPE